MRSIRMTTEEICMHQSETIERQAHLIACLLREVMLHRELSAAEKRMLVESSWDSVSK